MSKTVFLDTGVLGYITHPKGSEESRACVEWLMGHLNNGSRVCLPEVCDYELRRSYLLNKSSNALAKLDKLKKAIEYVPIESVMMLKAAELWAISRYNGKPTADPKELDGDVILAAQAITSSNEAELEIATTNVGHLGQFVKANLWRDVK